MTMINVLEQSALKGLELRAVCAFKDNYIWIAHNDTHALIVDPGQADPVLHYLQKHALELHAILITHHHADHVGGIEAIKQVYPNATVYGPARENIPHCDHTLEDGDEIEFPVLQLQFQVLDVPGHTAGHIAFFSTGPDGAQPFLFCGDTLFSIGCGRLFEGTPEQMLASLDKIAALPADTLICCAHEYTLSNILWALEVEPTNTQLQQYHQQVVAQRAQDQPTLPSRLGLELDANPFLRTREPNIIAAARQYADADLTQDSDVFAALRQWKNNH
ncbi:MAG TPA: hydroxyacylglutathione hydrolase [Paenalcaligenes sp.]|nr:hydroxyacylglutathione hydrolase [Paenalcaligenes sp.]